MKSTGSHLRKFPEPRTSRPPSNLLQRHADQFKSEVLGSDLRTTVGLSDMFQNQRPATQHELSNQRPTALNPVFNFHGTSSSAAQEAADVKDGDADSHFSEEW